jgi:hypothetical protein
MVMPLSGHPCRPVPQARLFGRSSSRSAAAGFVVSLALALPAATAFAQLDNAVTGTRSTPDSEVPNRFGLALTLADSSGLNAVGQNYRNELSLALEPRWMIGRQLFGTSPVWSKLSLSSRFLLSRALAGTSDESFSGTSNARPLEPCSEITPGPGGTIDPSQVRRCNPSPNDRRTDYSDVSLTASLPRYLTIPRTGVSLSSSLRATLPLSAQSRYQSLLVASTLTTSLSRGFFGEKLRASYSLGFTKNFHRYTTPGVSQQDGEAAEAGGNSYSAVAGVGLSNLFADPARAGAAGYNTSFSFSNTAALHYKIAESWSLDLLYMWVDGFGYGHRCTVDAGGQTVNTCRTGAEVAASSESEVESRGHRRSQVFWVTGTYGVNDWLSLSAAWVTWSPRHKPDTSYRQGFISTDYNAFTSVMLSTTVSVEELAGAWKKRRQLAAR